MAISNYTELKAAVADTLNRQDLSGAIPNFVALAEARMSRKLRARQMIKRAVATLDGKYIALPTDWLEARNVQVNVNGRPRKLEYLTLEGADDYVASHGRVDLAALPRYFNVTGDQLEIIPTPAAGTQIELAYYAKVPALSDTVPTNWVLTSWPDLYLYGSLLHSAPYLQDDPRLQTWSAIYDRLEAEMIESDQRAQYSGSVLRTRTNRTYP